MSDLIIHDEKRVVALIREAREFSAITLRTAETVEAEVRRLQRLNEPEPTATRGHGTEDLGEVRGEHHGHARPGRPPASGYLDADRKIIAFPSHRIRRSRYAFPSTRR